MRHLFTTDQAFQAGITESSLRWSLRSGRVQRVLRGVYVNGPQPPTWLERAQALVLASNGVACGSLAGILHGLDGVRLHRPFVALPSISESHRRGMIRRTYLDCEVVVKDGCRCTNGLETLLQLASTMSDTRWEQALESALRKRLLTVADVQDALRNVDHLRRSGTKRIRRVLTTRPEGAPPTESLLETLMVQLIRTTDLPTPERQVQVLSRHATFVARVDLAWPDVGLFLELDGQHHKDQPVYDARRETAIVATKGWLPGRFTWDEVHRAPIPTAKRVVELFDQAQRLHKPS
jgi:very-short-patch-repair endonuclease